MENQSNYKGTEGKKIALIGLAIAAVGIAGFVGWEQYKKYRDRKEEDSDPENFPATTSTPPPSSSVLLPSSTPRTIAVKVTDEFPLKQGSKGERVKQLQQALITRYGAALLKNQAPDGIFGPVTAAALKQKGYPVEINESYFNLIVKPGDFNAQKLSTTIRDSVLKKDFNSALVALKKIDSTDSYSAVNNFFSAAPLPSADDGLPKRHTLVTAMLMHFPTEGQKKQTSDELIRMGLKYDGSKWSLAGLPASMRIITTQPTLVWKDKNTVIQVPAKMVLGYEIEQRNGYSVFENGNNQQFLVNQQHIQYL